MDREKELEKQINTLREELHTIQNAKEAERNKDLIGKCFRYQNSYGGYDREPWWLYKKVTEVSDTGSVTAFMFEKRSDDGYHIETDRFFNRSERDIEIPLQEFTDAWVSFLDELQNAKI